MEIKDEDQSRCRYCDSLVCICPIEIDSEEMWQAHCRACNGLYNEFLAASPEAAAEKWNKANGDL